MPKYPNIKVKLLRENGNDFFILGRCLHAMRRARISEKEQDEFCKEATSGNYDHLLATCFK